MGSHQCHATRLCQPSVLPMGEFTLKDANRTGVPFSVCCVSRLLTKTNIWICFRFTPLLGHLLILTTLLRRAAPGDLDRFRLPLCLRSLCSIARGCVFRTVRHKARLMCLFPRDHRILGTFDAWAWSRGHWNRVGFRNPPFLP